MITKLIAKVTTEGKLELPPEILQQLQPNSGYEIYFTEQTITINKTPKAKIDIDEFLTELDQLEPDTEQPSLEEISEIVKEVRQKLWGEK